MNRLRPFDIYKVKGYHVQILEPGALLTTVVYLNDQYKVVGKPTTVNTFHILDYIDSGSWKFVYGRKEIM